MRHCKIGESQDKLLSGELLVKKKNYPLGLLYRQENSLLEESIYYASLVYLMDILETSRESEPFHLSWYQIKHLLWSVVNLKYQLVPPISHMVG